MTWRAAFGARALCLTPVVYTVQLQPFEGRDADVAHGEHELEPRSAASPVALWRHSSNIKGQPQGGATVQGDRRSNPPQTPTHFMRIHPLGSMNIIRRDETTQFRY